MLSYYPQRYPGELLASLNARYAAHVCSYSATQTSRDLYGAPSIRTAVGLPRNLNILHRNIAPFIDMSVDQIIDQLTLFPYYFAYSDEMSRVKTREWMKTSNLTEKYVIWNVHHTPPRALKVCRKCIEEDIQHYGETYWRRSHQVDCVHFCTKHLEP